MSGDEAIIDELHMFVGLNRGWLGGFARAEILIYTLHPTRNYHFRAWSTSKSLPARDEHGNVYAPTAGDAHLDTRFRLAGTTPNGGKVKCV